jgi:hypothetical protein
MILWECASNRAGIRDVAESLMLIRMVTGSRARTRHPSELSRAEGGDYNGLG